MDNNMQDELTSIERKYLALYPDACRVTAFSFWVKPTHYLAHNQEQAAKLMAQLIDEQFQVKIQLLGGLL